MHYSVPADIWGVLFTHCLPLYLVDRYLNKICHSAGQNIVSRVRKLELHLIEILNVLSPADFVLYFFLAYRKHGLWYLSAAERDRVCCSMAVAGYRGPLRFFSIDASNSRKFIYNLLEEAGQTGVFPDHMLQSEPVQFLPLLFRNNTRVEALKVSLLKQINQLQGIDADSWRILLMWMVLNHKDQHLMDIMAKINPANVSLIDFFTSYLNHNNDGPPVSLVAKLLQAQIWTYSIRSRYKSFENKVAELKNLEVSLRTTPQSVRFMRGPKRLGPCVAQYFPYDKELVDLILRCNHHFEATV